MGLGQRGKQERLQREVIWFLRVNTSAALSKRQALWSGIDRVRILSIKKASSIAPEIRTQKHLPITVYSSDPKKTHVCPCVHTHRKNAIYFL